MRSVHTTLARHRRAAVVAAAAVITVSALPAVVASASNETGGSDAAQRPDQRVGAQGLRDVQLRWRAVVSGLSAPTQVTSAPDGTKRLFVVQKGGQVRTVRSGNVLAKPYIAIGRRIDTDGEGGLLSIAFSPSFRRDGLVWVAYARASDGDLVIARMKANRAGASQIRARTLHPVLRVEHSQEDNHYGGQLAFGRGKHLLIGTGDGGGSGDPFRNGQDKNSLLGKILRIDPYHSCRGRAYCIPRGNPFADKRGRDEIWLTGLRNPWRFSVDPRTDDVWIGDVGQGSQEEIDKVGPHPRRYNLGWSCWEGRVKYNSDQCRAKARYVKPRLVYRHPGGASRSVTGGYVYRGDRFARQIGGAYVFADYVSHRVWLYKSGVGTLAQPARLHGGPTSFGVDDRGEIYAVTIDGVLHRMRVVRR